MSQDLIRIGTRASSLALAQAKEVKNLLSLHISSDRIEIVPITTSGDKIQDRNLADIGGKGLFIKELEENLINDKIDIAVHSAKDVPPIIHPETLLAVFTKRIDVRDCFISDKFSSIADLPNASVVGTSSARRKAILLSIRPDLKVVNFRGNVETRLGKVANGDVDASVLAVCGLKRLGKAIDSAKIIDTKTMLPSGGQGALAIQTRKNDSELSQIITKINHLETQICVKSERSFLRNLGASCATPVAVYAQIEANQLKIEFLISDYDGSEIFKSSINCDADLETGIETGKKAAEIVKSQAGELLKRIIS